MGDVAARWAIGEPILHAAWTTHRLIEDADAGTVRIGDGVIRYAAAFIDSLDDARLPELMRFEATRILLGHPYARRLPDPARAWRASNLCVQTYLRSPLPVPSPEEVFGEEAGRSHFEDYYRRLAAKAADDASADEPTTAEEPLGDASPTDDSSRSNEGRGSNDEPPTSDAEPPSPDGEPPSPDNGPEISVDGSAIPDDDPVSTHFRPVADRTADWGPSPSVQDAIAAAIEHGSDPDDRDGLSALLRRRSW